MNKVLIAVALALASGSAPAQTVKAGIDAWQKNDPARAVSIWKPLADKGDADAQFNLGQAYKLGRGVQLDLAAAQGWFERSARQGHADAQTSLGLMLFQNGNRIAGMRWLKTAAEGGEARAMLVYGTALFNGDGVPQDQILAYAFVSRAAAQGLAPAKDTLTQMDGALPLGARQRGVAMAQAMAAARPPGGVVPAGKEGKAIAARKVPPAPVATAAAPPLPHPAAAPVVAGGKWRIQLGAFSQRASADALMRRLANTVLHDRIAYFVPAGSVLRLQVGPYASKAQADSTCAALARAGTACFAVPER
ncbi:SPOR domain-containing protein [Sphingomonas ginkgonis]|nr:SPOR domain-containing protein [Sphingomonas ginkgonis]